MPAVPIPAVVTAAVVTVVTLAAATAARMWTNVLQGKTTATATPLAQIPKAVTPALATVVTVAAVSIVQISMNVPTIPITAILTRRAPTLPVVSIAHAIPVTRATVLTVPRLEGVSLHAAKHALFAPTAVAAAVRRTLIAKTFRWAILNGAGRYRMLVVMASTTKTMTWAAPMVLEAIQKVVLMALVGIHRRVASQKGQGAEVES